VKKNHKLIFLVILLLAIILRFYKLGSIPASLNWDEVSHGFNAYSLSQTGKDQWGVSHPVFNFRAYGDYPTTANIYLTIPFIKLFGLNSLAIRLPHAIIGTLTVVIAYFLAQSLFSNINLSLLTMFLFSVTPWLIFPSRAVFQSNLSLFFLILGLWLFLTSFKKHYLLILSLLSFVLSLYAYHNTRIIIPILIPFLFLIYRKNILKFNRILLAFSLVTFLLLAVPNILNLFSSESQARNRWVGIINPNSINLINENRRLFTGPQFLNRLVNNKVIYFSQQFATNYLDLLNPLPIFFRGSENYQFNPPSTGLIFSVFLPFFYFGLIIAFKKYRYLLTLFLICLLPAALTIGDFPSIRATSAVPFYIIFITLGINYLRSKLFLTLVILISLFQLIFYSRNYLRYNISLSQAWQYGYQTAINDIKPLYSGYQQIIFTKKYGEPHEFVLFYWPWSPSKYLSDPNKKWDFHADWYWVDAFDKFRFVNDWDIATLTIPKNTLLITSPGNYPKPNAKIIHSVNFLDNTPAFEIISYD